MDIKLISINAIRHILGLDKDLVIDHLEMAKRLSVTFYPYEGKVSSNTKNFYNKLKEVFRHYGVKIIPYNEAIVNKKNKLIKKGICLIALGEQNEKYMPIEHLSSYRENFILTILDDNDFVPKGINKKSFEEQADYGYSQIAYHFSNFIIGVSERHWVHFSGNGMFDVCEIDYEGEFYHQILSTVISKLFAPLLPIPMTEFEIIEEGFNPEDSSIAPYIDDVIKGGYEFSKTKLLDYKVRFNEMNFKKESYKKIIRLMFDNRSGAHLGYLSRQLPVKLTKVIPLKEAKNRLGVDFKGKDYAEINGDTYLHYKINNDDICLKVPEVSTLTSLSGTPKNNLSVSDIVRMGLKNGKMYLQFPKNAKIDLNDVRPSFDTKVILSNALSSTIGASLMRFYNPDLIYPKMLETNGMALAHWHGYILPKLVPDGWIIHGADYPVCMCSAHQAAVYGFMGKEQSMLQSIFDPDFGDFLGDIHIEPQHGLNITWDSLVNLADFILSNEDVAKNGIEYFQYLTN